ncbi:hypothetical protein J6590_017724 [Homalodisca vitripennis]|nr:hypothetical protein J6590_017724 [Homalodisca vitripennis]
MLLSLPKQAFEHDPACVSVYVEVVWVVGSGGRHLRPAPRRRIDPRSVYRRAGRLYMLWTHLHMTRSHVLATWSTYPHVRSTYTSVRRRFNIWVSGAVKWGIVHASVSALTTLLTKGSSAPFTAPSHLHAALHPSFSFSLRPSQRSVASC